MSGRDWSESYATGDLPWHTGAPDEQLVAAVERGTFAPGAHPVHHLPQLVRIGSTMCA